jgi:hypothetical protein
MESLLRYYGQSALVALGLIFLSLALGPLAPISEPLLYQTRVGVYDLAPPVYLSFSTFVSLLIFIIVTVVLWGSKSIISNVLVDGSAMALTVLNYVTYFVIWEIWKPLIYPLPFFLVIAYHGVKALQLDWAQIAIVIILYRLLRYHLRPHRLSEPDPK